MHMTDTPPLLFDTHCHLDAAEFAADRDAQVAQARAAGVGEMLVPAVEQANFADTLAMRAQVCQFFGWTDTGAEVRTQLHQ